MAAPALETALHDILNTGLGLLKSAEEKFGELRVQIETNYAELIARGAADQSETTAFLRGSLDQSLSAVKDGQTKVESLLAAK